MTTKQKNDISATMARCLRETDAPWRVVRAPRAPRRIAFVGRSGRPLKD